MRMRAITWARVRCTCLVLSARPLGPARRYLVPGTRASYLPREPGTIAGQQCLSGTPCPPANPSSSTFLQPVSHSGRQPWKAIDRGQSATSDQHQHQHQYQHQHEQPAASNLCETLAGKRQHVSSPIVFELHSTSLIPSQATWIVVVTSHLAGDPPSPGNCSRPAWFGVATMDRSELESKPSSPLASLLQRWLATLAG